jgi:TnpA family transposase
MTDLPPPQSPFQESRAELVRRAALSEEDLAAIARHCRGKPFELGFAYQVVFVRANNRFPAQDPFELDADLLDFASAQTNIPSSLIEPYGRRRQTIAGHRASIRELLGLRELGDPSASQDLADFLSFQARRVERLGALRTAAQGFLRESGILLPADSTLERLASAQRAQTREEIFSQVEQSLDARAKHNLEAMLRVEAKAGSRLSQFESLKAPPGQSSPAAMNRLLDKLDLIAGSGVLEADLSWLHENYQRALARQAKASDASKLRRMPAAKRWSLMACFLGRLRGQTLDQAVDMHDRLVASERERAETALRLRDKRRRVLDRQALRSFQKLASIVLDRSVEDSRVRESVFRELPPEELLRLVQALGETPRIDPAIESLRERAARAAWFRQYSGPFLERLEFEAENPGGQALIEGIETLRQLKREGGRGLPPEAASDFVQRRERPALESEPEGAAKRKLWEAALLGSVRDKIKAGDIFVRGSERFRRLDDFLLPEDEWARIKEGFFARAGGSGLPANPEQVPECLKRRLADAYDAFERAAEADQMGGTAQVEEGAGRWKTPRDPAIHLPAASARKLEDLRAWLRSRLRPIKLPELLIEADNALGFTRLLASPSKRAGRDPAEVCVVLASLMAHGCNVGPSAMARMTRAATRDQIQRASQWQLGEDALREALGMVADAICSLEASRSWGRGESSSSDGQRYPMRGQALERRWCPRLNGFGAQFYSFIADNYALFYSLPFECSRRDAPYALDGLLYNECERLDPREHYTDTHGYTEINFGAFAMLGRRLCPRIRGLSKQLIYRADPDRDHGRLQKRASGTRPLNLKLIQANWDRMGRLWAAAERGGSTTASAVLGRLGSQSPANEFYRACRELGRAFKTEFVLEYLASRELRTRIRRGLNKGEQLNALARQVFYGKQGTVGSSAFREEAGACGCLTLILACVVWWQIEQIDRALREDDPLAQGVDPALLEHLSPIEWDNILLYGEYHLDPQAVK